MSIVCSTLMCHAPIVIPSIAEERASACDKTTCAMREAARALVAHEPDLILLISPHTPRDRARFGLSYDDALRGSFARFGHRELKICLPGAPEAARALALVAQEHGLETRAMHVSELDHGALVPLHFVYEAGYRGRVLLIALPFPDASNELERAFGRAIRDAADASEERWALLASGDMSHRLTPDAPSGYDPRGSEFDQAFVTALRRDDLLGAVTLPHELVEGAGEDVVQSSAVALGALAPGHTRVLSYEGPFGVGYCVALLHTLLHTEDEVQPAPPELADVAFGSIATHLGYATSTRPALAPPWDVARPVFVTLRSPHGELRGCIGRTSPLKDTLADEIADCALAAATRDPRVPPIRIDELATLRVEVSVLHPPQPITSRAELDPQRYGVVVSHGSLRGVLLPAIEGVETVDEQLRVVLRKAHISGEAPYRIERFAVDKVIRGD